MKLRSIDLLGSPVHLCSHTQLLEMSKEVLAQQNRSYHFMALNPIKVIRSQKESELRDYLKRADVVYADAIGICLAIKLLYGLEQRRIPGYGLHLDVLALCQAVGHTIYIIGSKQEVLDNALAKYQQIFPGLKIVGSHHGYFSKSDFRDIILPDLKALQPRLVLVAMGALFQEYWIEAIREQTNVPLLLGIGGSLDAFVGKAPRAPRFMLDLGFEWLYRFIKQPKRWRVMTALPVFAVQTLQSSFKIGKF